MGQKDETIKFGGEVTRDRRLICSRGGGIILDPSFSCLRLRDCDFQWKKDNHATESHENIQISRRYKTVNLFSNKIKFSVSMHLMTYRQFWHFIVCLNYNLTTVQLEFCCSASQRTCSVDHASTHSDELREICCVKVWLKKMTARNRLDQGTFTENRQQFRNKIIHYEEASTKYFCSFSEHSVKDMVQRILSLEACFNVLYRRVVLQMCFAMRYASAL